MSSVSISEERWDRFVDDVKKYGSECFERSKITAAELGSLVRAMGSNSLHMSITLEAERLREALLKRSELPREDALAAAHAQREDALFAAFSWRLAMDSKELREWCIAALDLHMNRDTLFDFMLAARFGIRVEADSNAPYSHVSKVFREWTRAHPSSFVG